LGLFSASTSATIQARERIQQSQRNNAYKGIKELRKRYEATV
jgi:hypothetical protein